MSINTVSTTMQHDVRIGPTADTRLRRVATHAIVGGVAGAAIAAGLTFTALPFIGPLPAGIAAAIGGAAGLLGGAVVGLLRTRPQAYATGAFAGAGSLLIPPPPTAGRGSLPVAPPLP